MEHKTPDLYQNRIQVNDSIFIQVFQGRCTTAAKLIHQFYNERPHVGFNFCCSGATSFSLNGKYSTAYADTSGHNNFYIPVCQVTQELNLTPEIELITCYISADIFIKLIDNNLDNLPKKLNNRLFNQQNCYFESYQWKPTIKVILQQILTNKMNPIAQRLFYESKVLELVAIVFDMYTPYIKEKITISKTDIDKIHFAKTILLQDITNPPSLFQLAKSVGTNEFTLKKGFKEIFDMPVYKYLHKIRMENAALLLQTSDILVSEVALNVGYDSLSSFSQAFTKFYGISPIQLKNSVLNKSYSAKSKSLLEGNNNFAT